MNMSATKHVTTRHWRIPILAALLATTILVMPAGARTQLRNICRIKGQEENTLHGLGLVVGLNGTGEAGDGPTMRALARSMEVMGSPLIGDGRQSSLDELKKIKNAALVIVTATVPATGARRGDKFNCEVSALNGKSLAGGRLVFAALKGPNTLDKRVYALCEGQVTTDDPSVPTVGIVQDGCQMEADVFTPFYLNGVLTLVLDNNHANFQTAALIADEVDRKYRELSYSGDAHGNPDEPISRAIDAANIVVRIPEVYRDDPVFFASEVLGMTLHYEHEPEARVVINERAGSIVISGEVEIGDVVVSHKNIIVETVSADRFSSIGADQTENPRLKQLVDQLNALKVPTEDMIEIIRGIDRNGKLHGKLIIE
jgi:flagellar P-ring protein FlgI